MSVRPVLSALLRNKTGALLVAVQIALTLAVVVNAAYIVVERVERIGRPSGLDEANTFLLHTTAYAPGYNHETAIPQSLDILNNLPGAVAATTINAIPMSGGGSATSYYTEPGEKGRNVGVNYFEVNERGIDALGVKLVAGRNFTSSVVRAPVRATSKFVPEVIITRALGKRLFPDAEALGQTVYDNLSQPARIVGLLENMHGSWVDWDEIDSVGLHPVTTCCTEISYLVRAQPGRRDELMRAAEERISTSFAGQVIVKLRPLSHYKDRSYRADRNMATFLLVVICLLVAVAAFGIFGLATFNVQSRTRQIGTRRAIGARRGDIVSYFLIENWLITTAGVVGGCLLSLCVGYLLSEKLGLPRLNLYYLVGGVFGMWALGLVSAWWPARRASLVSPAVATRTV